MRLKNWHCLFILVIAVIVVYYPTLQAGFNSIDDLKMINWIDQAGPLDLSQLFLRAKSYYYRPLIILSYTLDRDLWGLMASFMHLENVLLHLACALLVFATTRRLLPLWGHPGQGPALFAGLFFALHPLATESVCWISGRTDPLMAVFLLMAVWLTVLALEKNRFSAALGAGMALLIAGLAKEVAVFILPGLLWLIAVYPGQMNWSSRLRHRWWHLTMVTAGVAGYFVMRHLAIGRDTGVSTALKGVVGGDYDLLNKGRIAFKVYGFYLKKLFVPWPLNFGIVEVSGWYVLAGVVLAALLLYLVWRRDVAGAFGLMAFFTLSPALLVIYGKMTWTPFAERYLYTSVALFAPLAAFMFLRFRNFVTARGWYRYDLAVVALLLLTFFATTLHRSWIWQDNLRLYSDTVAKSPDLLAARVELATALQKKGRVAEAEEILAAVQEESGDDISFVNDDIKRANMLFSKGEIEEARAVLLPLLHANPKKYYGMLQNLLRINDWRIGHAETEELRLAIQQESMAWLKDQYRLKPRAFTLYRIAKMQFSMDDKVAALISFKGALAKAPADAHYRSAAETYIKKLEGL